MSNTEKWAQLYTRAKLNEAQIKANPLPHLERMASQVNHLRQAIDEALYQLSGASSFDTAQELAPNIDTNMVETALARMERAQEVLYSALETL